MPTDNTKYIFNRNEYGKGRLVLAVVKQYMHDNGHSLNELKNEFPSYLQGSIGVVIVLSRVREQFTLPFKYVVTKVILEESTT